MTEFSIGSIIEANSQYLIAPHTVSGSAVSEPPVPFFHRHEEAIVQIDPSQVPAFMEAVRSDVEIALTGSGARIRGSGGDQPELIEQALASHGIEARGRNVDRRQEDTPADVSGFSYRYSDGEADGVIYVRGVRGQGARLVLIAILVEK
jgi:hypothetical protein